MNFGFIYYTNTRQHIINVYALAVRLPPTLTIPLMHHAIAKMTCVIDIIKKLLTFDSIHIRT